MKKFTLFLFLFPAFMTISRAQVQVSTVTEEFPGSGGVKFGPDGKVYIGNYGDALPNSNGTQTWRWEPDGPLEVFATGFQGASGNAFDSEGNFYQSNISGNKITKIDTDGNVSTYATEGIACPVGIVFDADDNLYVCNCCADYGYEIMKVLPNGYTIHWAGGGFFDCPNGITIDADQNLYVSNFGDGRVLKISSTGFVSTFATLDGGNNGHLTYSPADNSLYVASHGSSKIFRIDMDQQVYLVAGSGIRGNDDGPALQATFSRPNGIALSTTGDTIYVNSSIPVSDVGFPLNPSVLRMITGLQGLTNDVYSPTPDPVSFFKISPNPSQGPLRVNFHLRVSSEVKLQLVDINGRIISVQELGRLTYGEHSFLWDPEFLAEGLYQVNMISDDWSISRRLVLLK